MTTDEDELMATTKKCRSLLCGTPEDIATHVVEYRRELIGGLNLVAQMLLPTV